MFSLGLGRFWRCSFVGIFPLGLGFWGCSFVGIFPLGLGRFWPCSFVGIFPLGLGFWSCSLDLVLTLVEKTTHHILGFARTLFLGFE